MNLLKFKICVVSSNRRVNALYFKIRNSAFLSDVDFRDVFCKFILVFMEEKERNRRVFIKEASRSFQLQVSCI